MHRSLLPLALLTAALAVGPHGISAADQQRGEPSQQQGSLALEDRQFIAKAAQANLLAVRSSKLALERGATGEAKRFAKRMIADHRMATERLKDLSKQKGAAMPTDLDEQHQQTLGQLRQSRGERFEQQYLRLQIEAHRDAIELFRDATTACRDRDLRTFAAEMLPTLQANADRVGHLPGADQAMLRGQQGAQAPGSASRGTQDDRSAGSPALD